MQEHLNNKKKNQQFCFVLSKFYQSNDRNIMYQ